MITEGKCTVCESGDIFTFIDIPRVPVHCNVCWPTREEALGAPRGDIRLGFCRRCSHIFNLGFEPELMAYDRDYENSLDFSPRFREYATDLARRLIQRYDLHDKDIIEIGCGRGDFLKMLCELGDNRGTGFDPSYDPLEAGNSGPGKTEDRINFIREFYSPKHAEYRADFICCRHVLEHIQFPRELLTAIREVIGPRLETNLFFEVPNAGYTFGDLGIWDLIYEHSSYFTGGSLAYLFAACGFDVSDCREAFEGQFLAIEGHPRKGNESSHDTTGKNGTDIADHVEQFSGNYQEAVEKWRNALEKIRNNGKRAVVWGAGSKGVTFLNILQAKDRIEYAVDINPHKQGKFIAGSGQEIILPEFLKQYGPDIIIVMNKIYHNEIKQTVSELGLTPEFMFA